MSVEILKLVEWDKDRIKADAIRAIELIDIAYSRAGQSLEKGQNWKFMIADAMCGYRSSLVVFNSWEVDLEFRGPISPDDPELPWRPLESIDAVARILLKEKHNNLSPARRAKFYQSISMVNQQIVELGVVPNFSPRGWYFPIEDYAHSHKLVEGEVKNPAKTHLTLVRKGE